MNDNFTKQEIMTWIREKQIKEMEESHKQFQKNVVNMMSLVLLVWILNELLQYITLKRFIYFCSNFVYISVTAVLMLFIFELVSHMIY